MPTYEYACKSCGEHLEVVQSFSDDSLTTCPACEGELRKVFSAAGIIFKGSGWHIKDYSSDKGSSTTAPASSSDASEGGSSDTGASKGAGSSKDATASKDGGSSKDGGQSAKKKDGASSSKGGGTSTSNAASD